MCVCGDSSLVRSFAEPKKKSGEGNNFSKNSFNIFIHFVVVVCLFVFFGFFFQWNIFCVFEIRFLFVCLCKERKIVEHGDMESENLKYNIEKEIRKIKLGNAHISTNTYVHTHMQTNAAGHDDRIKENGPSSFFFFSLYSLLHRFRILFFSLSSLRLGLNGGGGSGRRRLLRPCVSCSFFFFLFFSCFVFIYFFFSFLVHKISAAQLFVGSSERRRRQKPERHFIFLICKPIDAIQSPWHSPTSRPYYAHTRPTSFQTRDDGHFKLFGNANWMAKT